MNYFAKVNTVKKIPTGTQLTLTVNDDSIITKLYKDHDIELVLKDKRIIRADQRKKIYATIRDISNATGNSEKFLKDYFKVKYCFIEGEKYFSLSNCSVTTARKFLNYIMEYVISEGIPLQSLGLDRTDDIDYYLYCCLKYRKCAITGTSNADIHHVEGSRVGMGRDRKNIDHSNLKLISLNREWHNKVHQEGEYKIFSNYKIYGITIDKETLKMLGIKTDEIN